MGISIPKGIFGFKGQSVNAIKLNKDTQEINVICRRDRRMKVIDHIPATQGVKIIKSLNLFASKVRIAVGFNLPSKMMGLKDLIKIEHRQFNE